MAGIYVHIPFCKKKCIYCDFYSVKDVPSLVEEYVQALKKEYAMRKCELSGAAVRSVYFGGGTPSVLPAAMLRDVLSGMDNIADDAEITVEVNPDDVDTLYAESLRAVGINRVSIGVQSFSDSELAFLNRRHDAKQAIHAVDVLRKAGLENISIDLIYGIPCQSLESWRRTLDVAVDIAPPHLSSYCLTYEEGTRLTRMRDRGEFVVVMSNMKYPILPSEEGNPCIIRHIGILRPIWDWAHRRIVSTGRCGEAILRISANI